MGVSIADDFAREPNLDEPYSPDQYSDHDQLAQMDAYSEYARDVDREAYRLRVREAAAAKIRTEKVADTDFDEQYLTRSQLATLPAPDPLIAGVLPRHSYGVLRGRDHSLKSFTAIDWACCLATGKHWQDRAVDQTRVLYIAGEGAHGLTARIDAWEYAWGRPVTDDWLTVRKTPLNLHQPGPAFEHLLATVRTGCYGLVIVDTLRRVSGAADGNSSEMGAVIDNLDLVKQATDHGTVLVVAHTDKGDHDTRGYSGIEDDADFVWAAKRDQDFLTLELTKMKDGPDGRTVHLHAQPSLDSLVLAGTDATRPDITNATQVAVLDVLRDIYRDGATPAQLVEATGLSKATIARAINVLEDLNAVVNTGTKRRKFIEIPPLPLDPDDACEGDDNDPNDPDNTGETNPPEDTLV